MKRTYNKTMLIEDLTKAEFKIIMFENNKYENCSKMTKRYAYYKDVKEYDIICGGIEAKQIEEEAGIEDDNHEYLVLHFTDGTIAVFRNSYVDLFIDSYECNEHAFDNDEDLIKAFEEDFLDADLDSPEEPELEEDDIDI